MVETSGRIRERRCRKYAGSFDTEALRQLTCHSPRSAPNRAATQPLWPTRPLAKGPDFSYIDESTRKRYQKSVIMSVY